MNILEFKERCRKYAPCHEGEAALDACANRKEVYEVMLHPQYYDFVMKSVQNGWGPTPEDILDSFGPFVNGGYRVSHMIGNRECTTDMWVRRTGVMEATTEQRILMLMGCTGLVKIPAWGTVKLCVDRSSSVEVTCGENALVYVECYGGRVSAADGAKGSVKIKFM